MGAVIPVGILGYEGQVIKEVRQDEATGKITVVCRRDRRHRPVDAKSGPRAALFLPANHGGPG